MYFSSRTRSLRLYPFPNTFAFVREMFSSSQFVLIEIRGLQGSLLHLFGTADDRSVCLVCAEARYFIKLVILAYASRLRSLFIHLSVSKRPVMPQRMSFEKQYF